MNALVIVLVALLAVLLVAFVVMLVITFRRKNPFRPAFASVLGAVILWVGHLSAPELEGNADINVNLPFFSMKATALRTSPKRAAETDFLAVGTLLVLLFLCWKGMREWPKEG